MNIFLVEDERWALAEMVELFKAYEPQHRIFAFDNGEDAFAALDEVRPHLILTDINMPGIDGLELIEKVSQADPAIRTVIISVHDQFEYARQGMKFGVFDYLLKPVKKDALFKTVDKALQSIAAECKRRDEWLAGTVTQMLLTGDSPNHDEYGNWNGRAFVLILLCLEESGQLYSWKDAVCMADVKSCLCSRRTLPEDIHTVDLDCRQRVLLVPLSDPSEAHEVKAKAGMLFEELRRLPSPVHVSAALKREHERLHDSFAAAKSRLEAHRKFAASSFVTAEMPLAELELVTVWDKVRVMERHCKKGDLWKGRQVLQDILAELERKRITKRQLALFVRDMLFSLKFNVHLTKNGAVNMNEWRADDPLPERITSFPPLLEWLYEKLVCLYSPPALQDAGTKGLVPMLIRLIHTQYQANISLQQFAADHHVSLGYLSRMFKHQTGSTFSDYIAGYRINKAKELLDSGVERMQDVGQLVGYEDQKHFRALFKKLVGETPMAYARRSANTAKTADTAPKRAAGPTLHR